MDSGDGHRRHARVVLSPDNLEYEPLVFSADGSDHVEVIAEMVTMLHGEILAL